MLGDIHGCGYRHGAALVRRGDGQMVQVGPLMYGLLEEIDGRRDTRQLADALTERCGRRVEEEHVVRLSAKLGRQGLLAGTEHLAPPRRNPLLALRFKVLVTNPKWTSRLTAPFAFLFRPWIMWPVLAAFVGVLWFVLFDKGLASATAQAFDRPALLLLVFVLAVASAGFHEMGHAAACRYGGARPGGMGMGLYLVWPAFYTDVTDTYRLPKRDRLRVDLGGLYFNAVVAVATMAVWLAVRTDALLLLVALQVLQMVKQLSPVIRADGYHILSDATGVPDLYSHMGPTMRRLLPGHRHEPSVLTGRARLLVTVWVLIIVPVLLSLMLGAVLVLPHIAASAWSAGREIVQAIPNQAKHGQVLDVLASLVRLLALTLPVLGSLLVTQKVVRMVVGKARAWSAGHPFRGAVSIVAGVAACAAIAWAWYPSGQYQPVRADANGTVGGLLTLISHPVSAARPVTTPAIVQLTPGTHLAVSMIPVGGATRLHPALFVIQGSHGKPAVAIESYKTPAISGKGGTIVPGSSSGTTSSSTGTLGSSTSGSSGTTTTGSSTGSGVPGSSSTTSGSGASSSSHPVSATAFPYKLPPLKPGETRATAIGTKSGGVTYDVAYSLVTVNNGAPVTSTNSAYALADCQACTTVAVSFQIVLIVGQSNIIAPVNEAGAENYKCPACMTTALAEQIVVTLKSVPTAQLLAELQADLRKLNALRLLGANGTPSAVAAEVTAIETQINAQLAASGQLANPPASSSSSTTPSSGSTTSTTSTGTTPNQTSTSPTSQTSTSLSSTTATSTQTTPTTATSTTATSTSSSPTTTSQSTTTSTSSAAAPATTPTTTSSGAAAPLTTTSSSLAP